MDYSITLDLPTVEDIQRVVNRQAFPLVSQAVRAIAQEAQLRWKDAVNHAPLWSGEKAPYVQSIKIRYKGDFEAEVYSEYKYAYEIENGRPPRDLKAMLDTSLKVRTSKKGRRYLIIPIRHNTPDNTALAPAMPSSVYALAKEMTPSSVTGQTTRVSGTGAWDTNTRQRLTVPQSTYKWGERLPAGLAPKLKASHKTDQYAGMVRFKTGTPGANSSAYMTFRVMAEGSPGWIIPAKPGLNLAKGVAEGLQPVANQAIAEAMKRTFKG